MVYEIKWTMDIFNFGRKKVLATLLTICCCLLMIIFPQTALFSARNAISLWLTDVLPALLPFFICANFLQNIDVTKHLSAGVFPFVMSVLSGYPMGSKIVGDLRRKNDISLKEAMRLMSFCNTSGPAFIIGAVGVGMLGTSVGGAIIAFSHYSGALINRFVYSKFIKAERYESVSITIGNTPIQEALTDAIQMSLKSLGIILAYIVIFMFATDMLEFLGILSFSDSDGMSALIKGIFEMTVGCEAVSEVADVTIGVKTVLCTFILSWGGLSIFGQTMSMLSGSGISAGYILLTKITHGLFSAGIAFVITLFML